MSKVLVTGGSGFIGAHLIRHLASLGHQVRGLVRPNSDLSRVRQFLSETVIGDLSDPAAILSAVDQVDTVYHLAGKTTGFSQSEFDRVNVEGTYNLGRCCADQPVPPRLIHVSSLAAAGPAEDNDHPKLESDTSLPVSQYGKSKRGSEKVLYQFAGRVPVSIVRPPIVLGEGDRHGLLMFKSIADNGLHLAPLGGHGKFSIIAAKDLAVALTTVADHGQTITTNRDSDQGMYHVSDNHRPSYAELGRMIGVAIGRDNVRVISVPKVAIWGLASGCELWGRISGRLPIMNFDKAREGTAGSWACSNHKIFAETGFRPAKSLQNRLQEISQWYFQNDWLKSRASKPRYAPARFELSRRRSAS